MYFMYHVYYIFIYHIHYTTNTMLKLKMIPSFTEPSSSPLLNLNIFRSRQRPNRRTSRV